MSRKINDARAMLLELVRTPQLLLTFLHFARNGSLRQSDIQRAFAFDSKVLSQHLQTLKMHGVIEQRGKALALSQLGKEAYEAFAHTDSELRRRSTARLSTIFSHSAYQTKAPKIYSSFAASENASLAIRHASTTPHAENVRSTEIIENYRELLRKVGSWNDVVRMEESSKAGTRKNLFASGVHQAQSSKSPEIMVEKKRVQNG